MLLLGQWLPNTVYLKAPPHLVLLLPGMLLGDYATLFSYQCLLHAVVMLHRPGVCGAEVGSQHLHSITQPRSGQPFIVNLSDHFLWRPAVVPLKVRRGGTALDMRLHAIHPHIYFWLVPINCICNSADKFA